MPLSKNLHLVLISVFLFSCSHTQKLSVEPTVSVSISDSTRLRFSGKGAGAGMMLMSTMGAAGVAIGIAIDEGIAKEINTGLLDVEFNVIEKAKEMFLFSVSNGARLALFGEAVVLHRVDINVGHYGFVLSSGGEEDMSALELKISVGINEQYSCDFNLSRGLIRSSEQFGQTLALSSGVSEISVGSNSLEAPLAILKQDGHTTAILLERGLASIFNTMNVHSDQFCYLMAER